MKFIKNNKYYDGIVYEWNLPTGTTCPFALECKVTVDKQTGKFDIKRGQYKCYAASPERFPGVREHRWKNFDYVKNGGVPIIPNDCTAIRIHASGDFFNQSYFDMWLQLAKDNPSIEMWAYTKSVGYWVKRINDIPSNLILTASYGGSQDYLIENNNLKNVKVFESEIDVTENRPIDLKDREARKPLINFALLDNLKSKNKNQTKLF